MEQIVKSLDVISKSQEFLKSNSEVLNKYWIEPRINPSPSPTPDIDLPTLQTLNEIITHINLIDRELEHIIGLTINSNLFDQVLNLTTWVELEKLLMGTFVKFNFIFGIPPEFTKPFLEYIDLDPTVRLEIGLEFVSEFKKIFGYKFLSLINREVLDRTLQVLSHVKKLYLAHY